jgi:hypothetical protein
MKNKNYCVVEYVNGNGFEDDEGVEIVSVKEFKSLKDGEKYLKEMLKEIKKMMNDNLELVKKEDYSGCEGEGYFEGGEFVYCMESEGGFILKEVK